MDKNKVDVQSQDSEKNGISGFVETLMRKNKQLAFVFAMTPVLFAYLMTITLSLMPAYLIISNTFDRIADSYIITKAFFLSLSITLGLGASAFSLLIVVVLFNKLIPLKVKNWRGNWYSLDLIPWYYHNALIQLVRYTVLPFFASTPIIIYFYRGMGMKIGRGCVINSVKIQDVCLIELEDYVTIGGSATIFCHYAQKGFMVLAPVIIKKGATIGLKSSIMGDVVIGEKVLVKAHSVVFPKSRLE